MWAGGPRTPGWAGTCAAAAAGSAQPWCSAMVFPAECLTDVIGLRTAHRLAGTGGRSWRFAGKAGPWCRCRGSPLSTHHMTAGAPRTAWPAWDRARGAAAGTARPRCDAPPATAGRPRRASAAWPPRLRRTWSSARSLKSQMPLTSWQSDVPPGHHAERTKCCWWCNCSFLHPFLNKSIPSPRCHAGTQAVYGRSDALPRPASRPRPAPFQTVPKTLAITLPHAI